MPIEMFNFFIINSFKFEKKKLLIYLLDSRKTSKNILQM